MSWDDPTSADASAWVARFAPLLTEDAVDGDDLRRNIKTVSELRSESAELKERLSSLTSRVDPELVETFNKATQQLDSLDSDFRKRLARVAPGDPLGLPDLEVVQEKIAEREARQELGVSTGQEVPEVLDLKTSSGNIAGAAFMGVFGLGWTSFTTLHAFFMIGGMMKAFGPVALFLLLFYSIFFMVGFGMLAGAFLTAANESVSIEGQTLTITRTFGPLKWKKKIDLAKDCRAVVGVPMRSQNFRSDQSSSTGQAVILTDTSGRPVNIASQTTDALRESVCKQINAYLDSQESID